MKNDENGWISVDDALPEEGEDCFVYYKDQVFTGWCFTKYCNKYFEVKDVTHWRPVFNAPASYKL